MGWVLDRSQSKGRERLVLLSIANHAGSTGGNVYCGLARIAHESHVHRATVIRAITHLEELGELLVYEHRGVAGRGGVTNRYEMPLVPGWSPPKWVGTPRLDPCGYHPQNWSHDATANSEVVANGTEVVAPRAPRGRNGATRTVLNRSMYPGDRCVIDGEQFEFHDGCWVPVAALTMEEMTA